MSEKENFFTRLGKRIKGAFVRFGKGTAIAIKSPDTWIKVSVVLVFIALGIFLFFFGKEHQFLLDNNTIDINGTTYSSLSLVEAKIDDSDPIEIPRRSRMNNFQTGQSHTIAVTYLDGAEEKEVVKKFKVPSSEKNTLISIPALLGGAGEDEWKSEFISAIPEPTPQDEEVVTDEMAGLTMDF